MAPTASEAASFSVFPTGSGQYCSHYSDRKQQQKQQKKKIVFPTRHFPTQNHCNKNLSTDLGLVVFRQVCHHDNDTRPLLINHAPEITDGVGQRTCREDDKGKNKSHLAGTNQPKKKKALSPFFLVRQRSIAAHLAHKQILGSPAGDQSRGMHSHSRLPRTRRVGLPGLPATSHKAEYPGTWLSSVRGTRRSLARRSSAPPCHPLTCCSSIVAFNAQLSTYPRLSTHNSPSILPHFFLLLKIRRPCPPNPSQPTCSWRDFVEPHCIADPGSCSSPPCARA